METVYFRSFELEDAENIYKWMNDDRLLEMTVGLSRRICKQEAEDWIKNRMSHNPYQVYWAICSKENDRMIGYASLVNIHYINSCAETGAIMIGDPEYNDGAAWIEGVLWLMEYAFERLNLNRVYGESLVGHKMSNRIGKLMFFEEEGILRQAAFKNGRFYDLQLIGILKDEYFAHKQAGDYDFMKVVKRLRRILKEEKQEQN